MANLEDDARLENEKEARQISEAFITRGKEKLIADTKSKMSLDDLYNKIQEGNVKDLNLIIKADVQGSVEAVKQSLEKLSNEEVIVKVISRRDEIINNESTMNILKELKDREEKEEKDFAHSIGNLLGEFDTFKEYNPKRLITMFGAGGNRPKIRRYEMGETSGKFSDLSVITSDNPRNENPLDIIEDIKLGINKTNGKYIVIPDRKEAIEYCIKNAEKGDIIVLAGKGHEDYQEINGVKYPFDERMVINDIVNKK